MSLEQVLADYGYLAVLVGCYLEGETMLVIGGIAASRGDLRLEMVMAFGFLGGFAGDQLYFHLGRRCGPGFLSRRPRLQASAVRVTGWLERHRDLFIFGFRFLYGLRVVSPLTIGLTRVSALRFTTISAIGGVIWAISVTALGCVFGHGLQAVLARCQTWQVTILVVIALGTVAVIAARRIVCRGATARTARNDGR